MNQLGAKRPTGRMAPLQTALDTELATITNTTDPTERAIAALALVEWLRTVAMQQASEVRTAAVRRMYHDEGLTLERIGQRLGVSRQRAQQLVSGVR